MTALPRPLDGLLVLDVGTALAGPVCATILAEFGATVIKVERPGAGDPLRTYGPAVNDVPLWWAIEGRNKRSMTIELSHPKGQEILRELARSADALVENFRPGTMARWGLGVDDLRQDNPGLVYVSVSGYGQSGPNRSRPAYDRVAQALAGFTYLTGEPDGPPLRPGIGITDYSAAIVAALGAVLALYARDATPYGTGQQVDVALYEPILRMFHYHLPMFEHTGRVPERTGNFGEAMVPAGCFRTQDDQWLVLAVGSDGTFTRLAAAMDRADLTTDPRFRTNTERSAHAEAIHGIVEQWVRGQLLEDALVQLEELGVPAGPVYSAREVHADEHFRARESVVTVDDPVLGNTSMQGIVPRLIGTPGEISSTGPALGQHTDEILRDHLGLDDASIRQLRDEGAI